MMQFTEIPFSHHQYHQTTPLNTTMNKSQFHRIRPWPGFIPPPSSKSLPLSSSSSSSSTSNLGDANCMEQLLVHCANAIENNDATPAQQILWVLNNIAPPDGDSTQRLTCAFLRSLILRASLTGTCKMMSPAVITTTSNTNMALATRPHRFSLLELAHFVDLTPWHRFGFTAANSAIIDFIAVRPVVHIVDLSATHCMQFPTLIEAIATRFHPPPLLRLTVAAIDDVIPPSLDLLSYDDLGSRLVNFANTRNISLEFKAVPTSPSDGYASLLQQVHLYSDNSQQQAVIVNCQLTMHCLLAENHSASSTPSSLTSMRTMFLQTLRRLEPDMVVVVEEDVDLTARDLMGRLRAAFNYFWIPFDTVDTFLPRGSNQREWYEADVCWKIENIIAREGEGRVERQETRGMWGRRMREVGFRGAEFGEEAATEVKGMLEEHAAGWGAKREEDDLVLTWKGHNVVFASAWVPT